MLLSISSTILHVRYSEHANSKSVQSSPIWRYWLFAVNQQANIWANVDQDLCHHMMLVGHNDSINSMMCIRVFIVLIGNITILHSFNMIKLFLYLILTCLVISTDTMIKDLLHKILEKANPSHVGNESLPYLLMSWLWMLPEYQQAWYWLNKIDRTMFSQQLLLMSVESYYIKMQFMLLKMIEYYLAYAVLTHWSQEKWLPFSTWHPWIHFL